SAESHHTSLGDPTFSQPPLSSPSRVPTLPYDLPISRGHTPGRDEGSLTLNELTFLYATRVYTYSRRSREVSTGRGGVSTASRIISIAEETVSTTGVSMPVSTAVSTTGVSMPVSTAGMVQESIYLPRATKDKGKAIMTESEPEQTTTKLKERRERVGYEATIRLQEQHDEEENQRIARDAEIAQML
nr:hypothetical protein [Tanacetum cinerariifolium]